MSGVLVPSDLWTKFGKTIGRALKTNSKDDAKAASRRVMVEIEEQFERTRRGEMTPLDIEAEAREFMHARMAGSRQRPGRCV